MIIRIMKKDALEALKDNLKYVYMNYYTQISNKWLWDVCNGNPFEDYKTIPDFNLASLELPKGEIDFQNIMIVYKHLDFITESQACDERLWAGLCHDVFYDYLRRRWDMINTSPKNVAQTIGNIATRFLFKDGIRSGCYRNSLAKCWWIGRTCFNLTNNYRALEIIGSNDLNTKINDIFRNYNFTSNTVILQGIIDGIEYFSEKNLPLKTKEHIRPALQYINAVGGGTILDYLDTREIKKLFINQVYLLMGGQNIFDSDGDTDDVDIFSDEDSFVVIDPGEVIEKIIVGDMVSIQQLSTTNENRVKNFKISYNENHELYPIAKVLIGKSVGEKIVYDNKEYVISAINPTQK